VQSRDTHTSDLNLLLKLVPRVVVDAEGLGRRTGGNKREERERKKVQREKNKKNLQGNEAEIFLLEEQERTYVCMRTLLPA
jgi:hypothetical protein